MGLIKGVIHCDTSFKNEICQTGYIINIDDIIIEGYSPIFQENNNNDAEIKGIQIAANVAVDYILLHYTMTEETHYEFTVYNDNITAVHVADYRYSPKPKIKGKFDSTTNIQNWCTDNNVILKCCRKKRSHPTIKKCDRLSKAFRKDRRKASGLQLTYNEDQI